MTEIDLVTLQKEADLLDRELGQELLRTQGRTKKIETDRAFPIGSWILSVVLVGCYVFGGSIPAIPYDQLKEYIFIVAVVNIILSIFFTIRFIWSRLAGGRKVKEIEDSPKAVELRTKRDAIRAKIEEIKDEKKID